MVEEEDAEIPDGINCWEYKKCGQEKLDDRDKNKCPVVKLADFGAGKVCWLIHASRCDGKLQGGAGSKYMDCKKCSFFKKMHQKLVR